MSTYTIIGGDKKEYGPVSDAEMRQWITEGRLDGNTQARADNDTEWRPLSTFPEFSLLFQPRAQTPPPLNALGRAMPKASTHEVSAPAICLIVTAIINILWALWNIVSTLLAQANPDQELNAITSALQFLGPDAQKTFNDPQFQKMFHAYSSTGLTVAEFVFTLCMSVLVLLGALRMKALRNYEFACIAAILAMVPCLTTCCCLGLPFGIWALLVLRKPGIKDQFN